MTQQFRVGTHATTIARQGDTTRVTYHSTVVVQFDDRTVTLNSGGWRSLTTKTRMNQAARQFDLGYYVYQRDHLWYVALPNDGEHVAFYDGISFDYR